MPEEYSPQELPVVAAARAMLLAGGAVPPQRLAAVSGCSLRQLEIAFDQVLGATPHNFAVAIELNNQNTVLKNAPRVALAINSPGFRHTRGYFGLGEPMAGPGASHLWREGTYAGFAWTQLTTSIGTVVVVAADHGLVEVKVLDNIGPDLPRQLAADFPGIRLRRADDELAHVRAVLAALSAGQPSSTTLPTDVPHTDFQARVWQALRGIPASGTRSYAQVAREIGAPKAVRAVGRACATNPVALVVPCHRVVRSDGRSGGYRWGASVKARLLELEKKQELEATPEGRSSQ